MKATLTQSKPITSRRARPGRSIVYVRSTLDAVADEFYNKYEIFDLQFKCRTWSSVCGKVTKVTTEALKDIFAAATSIKFSHKAGCSCGCSPGYIVKYDSERDGRNYWVDIEWSEQELNNIRASVFSERTIASLFKEKEKWENASA